MFPDLSYILHFLVGSAPDNAFSIVKTFGLFLTLAFLASAFVLHLEFKRKEREGIFQPQKMILDFVSSSIFVKNAIDFFTKMYREPNNYGLLDTF